MLGLANAQMAMPAAATNTSNVFSEYFGMNFYEWLELAGGDSLPARPLQHLRFQIKRIRDFHVGDRAVIVPVRG